MKAYWAIMSARFRMLLQYRAAALAGFITQCFWGLIRIMIFEAFYRATTAAQPMTLPQVIDYIWLGQAMFALLPWALDVEVAAMVRTGTVAYELLRPIDLYSLWFMRNIANRAAPTFLRCVPMLIVAGLFLGLRAPASLASGAACLLAAFGALLLVSAIATMLGVSLFWTISGEGLAQLMFACIIMFSGIAIPLPLFPDWVQPIVNFLPFRGILDTPARLYSGNLPPGAVWSLFAHQLLWMFALIGIGRLMLSRATRRLVVQGG